jgi:hypothetical protein
LDEFFGWWRKFSRSTEVHLRATKLRHKKYGEASMYGGKARGEEKDDKT